MQEFVIVHYFSNFRALCVDIRIKYEDDYFPPQTRDHIHISLEDDLEPYTKEASVLEPIKPMMYDPYLYDENVPMTMDEYYYDYYDCCYDYYDYYDCDYSY